MYKRVSHARAALMGLLFAMVGFTYALATSRGLESAAGAESRGVGTEPLRFLNNVGAGGDRDLGDVTIGSFLTRYARAAGGIGQLTYTSTRTPTFNSVRGASSTLELFTNGCLGGAGTTGGGQLLGLTAANFPLRFTIDVADQRGSNPFTAFDTFRLSLEATDTFKFAIDDLGDAIQFESLMDIVSTVNGNGAVTVTASNVQLNGAAVTGGLAALGLNLAADGTLVGQPLQAGRITFTATARDARGNSALSRDKSTVNQVITLDVIGNSVIETNAVCLGLSIKVANPTGAATSGNKDSASYKGIVNLGQRKISDLNGDALKLVIGGYSSPNTTNTPATLQGGKTVKPPKVTGTKPAKLTGSVKQSGQVSIKISGEDMSRISSFSGSTQNLAVGVVVGDAVAAAQILTVTVKRSNKGSVNAGYKFSAANTPAGTFILTKVSGKDDTKSAAEDDAWQAQFIATPATGQTFSGSNRARVSIGQGFEDTINVKENKSKVSQDEKRDSKSAKVTQIKMDGVKGKGSVKTGFLPSTLTGIREASKATTSAFPLNITLLKVTGNASTLNYAGENSLNISSNGKSQWKNLTK
ncbi:MAG TPA: hypothetical protein VEJ63_19765 [Planctomycetota bacterium]|nr:hypothetical protein [Planctomycetota bacterium]